MGTQAFGGIRVPPAQISGSPPETPREIPKIRRQVLCLAPLLARRRPFSGCVNLLMLFNGCAFRLGDYGVYIDVVLSG